MAESHQVFLSVVCVLRDQAGLLEKTIAELAEVVSGVAAEYELVIVDNASTDNSIEVLKRLTGDGGLPNVQVFALTKEVDPDTGSWVGMENALGDFLVVIDPMVDDIHVLPEMLSRAMSGTDVVFARNTQRPPQTIGYRTGFFAFNLAYRWIGGIHLAKEAPQYRLLSKKVVSFLLQHPQPAVTYRHLPATGGFSKATLTYRAAPRSPSKKRLSDNVDRGIRLLISTTRAPMRLVTALSLFGAGANVLYSLYVVAVGIFKPDVAPGWVSLSLQQSGMFFLISLVLFVLGEYILNMVRLTNEGPLYHIGQEFMSARITRREKLNVVEPGKAGPGHMRLVDSGGSRK